MSTGSFLSTGEARATASPAVWLAQARMAAASAMRDAGSPRGAAAGASTTYTCECGHGAPFAEHVLHQRTCAKTTTKALADEQKANQISSARVYSCQWKCGYAPRCITFMRDIQAYALRMHRCILPAQLVFPQ